MDAENRRQQTAADLGRPFQTTALVGVRNWWYQIIDMTHVLEIGRVASVFDARYKLHLTASSMCVSVLSSEERVISVYTCNRKTVGDVAGFEAEVVLFPGGIDTITSFKDHFNSTLFLIQIPAWWTILRNKITAKLYTK